MDDRLYETGVYALNANGYDWHVTTARPPSRIDGDTLAALREWLGDFDVKDGRAGPFRAFLDLMYLNIRFLKRVPNHRIEFFLYDENEERKLLELIDENGKDVRDSGAKEEDFDFGI